MNEQDIKPTFQTRPYKVSKSVFLKDRYQQYLYIKHGAKMLDCYSDSFDNLVMVFDKKETQELYKKWRNRELS